jgi:glucose-6-phosphate isomerase
MNISLDYTNLMGLISQKDIDLAAGRCRKAREETLQKTGRGREFLGWVDLPGRTDDALIEDITETARVIRKESDIFIAIGIGGSYLGAKAAVEALTPSFHNHSARPMILFAGNSISPGYMAGLLKMMEGRNVSLNVISKSGTTTEPAIAFRLLWEWMVKTYGRKEAGRRTIATTDASKGALKKMAGEEGFKTYVIPDDVGGRFSVLTPVGLLPIAVAGIDIREMMEGARQGAVTFRDEADPGANPSAMYAILRNILYEKGCTTEILANFEPSLHYLSEWWKQLFGESEGKEHKGIFPASCDFTTDLHSMGQWIQDGPRHIFETFLSVEDPGASLAIGRDPQDLDGLNFLAGKTLGYVNEKALMGTRLAHREGGTPNMTINIPGLTPRSLGGLFYFFQWAVALSGYMLGVNPFDQPGVESYKKAMFALLEKPGYEKEFQAISGILGSEKPYVCGGQPGVKAGR